VKIAIRMAPSEKQQHVGMGLAPGAQPPLLRRIGFGTLAATAHHEAGHAIAAVAYVGRVHELSIEGFDDCAGYCATRSYGRLDNPGDIAKEIANWNECGGKLAAQKVGRLRAELLGHARFGLAGWCAEVKFTGLRIPVSRLLNEDTLGALNRIDLAGYDPDQHIVREVRRTYRFLRMNWLQVQSLASALLTEKTLDAERFDAILKGLPPVVTPACRP